MAEDSGNFCLPASWVG